MENASVDMMVHQKNKNKNAKKMQLYMEQFGFTACLLLM